MATTTNLIHLFSSLFLLQLLLFCESSTLSPSPPFSSLSLSSHQEKNQQENVTQLDSSLEKADEGARSGRTFFGDIGGFLRPHIFNIVRFPNEECLDASNQMGTCYTALECKKLGGNPSSKCARGLGTCCISKWPFFAEFF